MTKEEINQSISAAYDSVNLINKLNSLVQPLSVDNEDTKSRNVEHLKIMINTIWFLEALTEKQIKEINSFL